MVVISRFFSDDYVSRMSHECRASKTTVHGLRENLPALSMCYGCLGLGLHENHGVFFSSFTHTPMYLSSLERPHDPPPNHQIDMLKKQAETDSKARTLFGGCSAQTMFLGFQLVMGVAQIAGWFMMENTMKMDDKG